MAEKFLNHCDFHTVLCKQSTANFVYSFPDDYYAGSSVSTPKIVKQDPNSKDSSENNRNRRKGGFGSNSKDCQQFVIIGAVLGCALVASSLMMCFLSARLMRLTKQYKREKLGTVKPKNYGSLLSPIFFFFWKNFMTSTFSLLNLSVQYM